MKRRVLNGLVYGGWVFITLFTLTFQNRTMWVLLFFVTPLLLVLTVMVFLPLAVSLEGYATTTTLSHTDSVSLHAYTRSLVRFRLLIITLRMELENETIQSNVRTLDPKRMIELSFDMHEVPRGQYRVGKTEIVIRDFIGLLGRSLEKDTIKEIIICPAKNASTPHIAEYLDRQMKMSAPYRNRDTYDLKTMREYYPGDRLNHIDWKLSSKLDGLIYRDYMQEDDQPLSFIFVAIRHEMSEWMLSLFYTLHVDFFKNLPLKFGIVGIEPLVNPVDLDYAELNFVDDVDLSYVSRDAVIFSPLRLETRQPQLYFDHDYLVFELNRKRDIIGKLDQQGVLQ